VALGLLLGTILAISADAASLEGALAQAATDHGNVLVVFASPLVPPSETLARDLADRMDEGLPVPVLALRADPYDGASGTALAQRFNLHVLPTLLLLQPDGSELARVEQPMASRDVRRALADLLAGRGALARLRKQETDRPGDLEVALALGRELASRGDLAGARLRLQKVAAAGTPRALATRARYDLALSKVRDRDVDGAVEALRAIVADDKGSAQEDAEIALAQLLVIQGDPSEAARVLERFRVAHPEHARDAEVETILQHIRSGGSPTASR